MEKIRRNKTQWSVCPSVDQLVSPLAGRLVVSVGCLISGGWSKISDCKKSKVKHHGIISKIKFVELGSFFRCHHIALAHFDFLLKRKVLKNNKLGKCRVTFGLFWHTVK